MRILITTALCCTLLCSVAQTRTELPPVPSTPKNEQPGYLITQGARMKNAGLVVGLLLGGAGAAIASNEREGAAEAGLTVAGIGLATCLVLNLSGNSKHARAGKLMQRVQ